MIGIISLYYQNYNLGGLLQAYALQNYIQENKGDCQQIRISRKSKKETHLEKLKKKFSRILRHPILEIKASIDYQKNKRVTAEITAELSGRYRKLERFADCIPHSDKVYTSETIENSMSLYDCYVVGSDQVWNNNFLIVQDCLNIHLLDFVPNTHKKISYAASIGRDITNDSAYRKRLNHALRLFDKISIREKSALAVLDPDLQTRTEILIDPTLLLNKEKWDKIAESSKVVPDARFAFVYFLGDDKQNRIKAKKITEACGLKICSFIHARNKICKNDVDFADFPIIDYGVEDFIAMIDKSVLVITDSFHASVFSIMYKKDFFVLQREITNMHESMNSRITHLLDTFHLSSRLIMASEPPPLEISPCDFTVAEETLSCERKKAIDFLAN